jgi:hypothetical protein
MKHRRTYDPDLDLNSVVPCNNPADPAPLNRRRHRLLMDMLLEDGDFVTCRKILGAYPYLKSEYSRKLLHAWRIWHAIDLLEGGKDWPEMLEIMMLTRTDFDDVLNRVVGRDNPERAGIEAECSTCRFGTEQ